MAEAFSDREDLEPNSEHSRLVSDPVEAERMAHAMDPHYEQASQIDEINLETHELAQEERRRDAVSLGGENGVTDTATKGDLEAEAASWVEREINVEDERTALDTAAGAARKAGDAAGDQASIAYQQEQ